MSSGSDCFNSTGLKRKTPKLLLVLLTLGGSEPCSRSSGDSAGKASSELHSEGSRVGFLHHAFHPHLHRPPERRCVEAGSFLHGRLSLIHITDRSSPHPGVEAHDTQRRTPEACPCCRERLHGVTGSQSTGPIVQEGPGVKGQPSMYIEFQSKLLKQFVSPVLHIQ